MAMENAAVLISRILSLPFELDDEEWIDQVLVVGNHCISHGVKLGMLRSCKCSKTVIPVKHIGHRIADSEFYQHWASMLRHRLSVAAFQALGRLWIRVNVVAELFFHIRFFRTHLKGKQFSILAYLIR